MTGGLQDARTDDFAIRAPRQSRLGNAALLVGGSAVAVAVTVILALRGSIWAVGAALALGVWVAYYYRLTTLSVVARGDVLEVRNLFATRRLDRSAIVNVRLGESSVAKGPSQTITLDLAGGEHLPLDACAITLTAPAASGRLPELRRRLVVWSESSVAEKPLQDA